jgi:hypothetical protein
MNKTLENKIVALTQLYGLGEIKKKLRKKWNFRGKYKIINRSNNSKFLVIVVAGYKQDLWSIVFPRIAKYISREHDVCIVTPGKYDLTLVAIAELYGWSILWTDENRIGFAQNIAIDNHPHAEYIIKLDEDIIISQGFDTGLLETLYTEEKMQNYSPGFIAPLLNINGFSSRIFLSYINKTDEFEMLFGKLKSSCVDTPVWDNPDAAKYLWDVSDPFDSIAKNFFEKNNKISICNHRFSIGAILFRRGTWKEMGGFSVAPKNQLGLEEIDLCAWCCVNSRAMIITDRVFAGHAGFQSQLPKILPILNSRKDLNIGW